MDLGVEIPMEGELIDDIEACAVERGISVSELIINAVRNDLVR
jgi:hypothetical protein